MVLHLIVQPGPTRQQSVLFQRGPLSRQDMGLAMEMWSDFESICHIMRSNFDVYDVAF